MIGGILFFLPFAVVGAGAALLFFAIATIGLFTGRLSSALWGMLVFSGAFACAFGGVGFWGMGTAIGSRRRARRRAALQQTYPSEPWQWRKDWASGEIRSSRGSAVGYLIWFVATWNLIVWAVSLFRTPEMEPLPQWGAVLLVVAKIIGVAGGLYAIKAAVMAWRGRTTRLRLNATPIRLGGRLSGQIFQGPGTGDTPNRAVLICEERIIRQSGSRTTITDVAAFSTSSPIDPHSGIDGVFAVDIPMPSDAPLTDDTHTWSLHIDAEGVAGGRIATFELPVF